MRETLPLAVPPGFTALLWLRLSLTAQVRYVVSFGWETSPGDGCLHANVTLTVALSYGPPATARPRHVGHTPRSVHTCSVIIVPQGSFWPPRRVFISGRKVKG